MRNQASSQWRIFGVILSKHKRIGHQINRNGEVTARQQWHHQAKYPSGAKRKSNRREVARMHDGEIARGGVIAKIEARIISRPIGISRQ